MEHKNIHEAMAAVYARVGYVQKERAKKDTLPYTFASERALIEALRPAMVEAGITMHVVRVESFTREVFTSKSGTPFNVSVLALTVRFTHALSQTHVDVESVGEGADSGDKSTPKAMTGAYKYALRQTFCIETGDDPDEHSSEQMERRTTVKENLTVPDPRQPAMVPVDVGDAPDCAGCGQTMTYREGVGAKGPYRGWFCSERGHPVRWMPSNEGE